MDAKHIEMIRTLPSCISGLNPCEAHHLKIKQERGVGLRATDRWAVPLTHKEHMELERFGSRKEEEWFKSRNVRCYELANALWGARGFRDIMLKILAAKEMEK